MCLPFANESHKLAYSILRFDCVLFFYLFFEHTDQNAALNRSMRPEFFQLNILFFFRFVFVTSLFFVTVVRQVFFVSLFSWLIIVCYHQKFHRHVNYKNQCQSTLYHFSKKKINIFSQFSSHFFPTIERNKSNKTPDFIWKSDSEQKKITS